MVGDNRTYGGYHNAPLNPGSQYVVWFGVHDSLDGVSDLLFRNAEVEVDWEDISSVYNLPLVFALTFGIFPA